MFREFDETVQKNKIAKLFFEAGFTHLDVEKIIAEVRRCNKFNLNCNLTNLIFEMASYKLPLKEGYEVRKLLALNEQQQQQAQAQPAQQQQQGFFQKIKGFFGNLAGKINKAMSPETTAANALKQMQTQITNLYNALKDQTQDYGNKQKYMGELQKVGKALGIIVGETAKAGQQADAQMKAAQKAPQGQPQQGQPQKGQPQQGQPQQGQPQQGQQQGQPQGQTQGQTPQNKQA